MLFVIYPVLVIVSNQGSGVLGEVSTMSGHQSNARRIYGERQTSNDARNIIEGYYSAEQAACVVRLSCRGHSGREDGRSIGERERRDNRSGVGDGAFQRGDGDMDFQGGHGADRDMVCKKR